MTLQIYIGRRIPRNWFRRQANTVGGLFTFQENIWLMIKQSFTMAKRKATASGTIKFIMTNELESEDLHYQIEWIKIIVQGTKEQEKEEYDEAMTMYQPFGKIFKKDLPKDANLSRQFKTKLLNVAKVDEAYKQGYGAVADNNLANKLLEMGIMTHIELNEDYDTREDKGLPQPGNEF